MGTNGDNLPSLLFDDAVMRFMEEQADRYLPYEEFERQNLPRGRGPQELWQLLNFARRIEAWPTLSEVGVSGGLLDQRAYWRTAPRAVTRLFDMLGRSMAQGSLWQGVQRYARCTDIQAFLVNDLAAAAARGSLFLSRETVRAVVGGFRKPFTPDERLVANAYHLIESGAAASLLEQRKIPILCERLLDGAESVGVGPQADPDIPSRAALRHLPFEESCSALEDAYNLDSPQGFHGLLGSLWATNAILDQSMFGALSGFVELVLRHGSYERLGIPALGYVPLSALRIQWEQGALKGLGLPRYGDAVIETPYGLDCTPGLEVLVTLLEHGLHEVQDTLAAIERRNASRLERIATDARLNPRQQEVAEQAIRNPQATFDVWRHQLRTGTAPSTARKDLNDLVRYGYLVATYEGKRQVFSPNPSFVEP